MKKREDNKCTPCEERFEKGIDEIVGKVKDYTEKKRKKMEKDVKTAFGNTHKR